MSVDEEARQRVLVVDDEPYLADLVATAGSVGETIAKVGGFRPDLIVLDIVLPDESGLQACRRLRQDGYGAPIVFLTARDATEDKIAGLTMGGDDYVTKPFSLEELIARIRAVLRRTRKSGRTRLTVADLEIDQDAHEVRRAGHLVPLSPTEFALLRYLVLNAGRVLSKRQLLDHVWNYDFDGNDGVVQTYISYLRRKLDGHGPPLIHTLPRVGYILRAPREA